MKRGCVRTHAQLVEWAVAARDHGLISTERASWVADMHLQDFIQKFGRGGG